LCKYQGVPLWNKNKLGELCQYLPSQNVIRPVWKWLQLRALGGTALVAV